MGKRQLHLCWKRRRKPCYNQN